ncbi:MAG: polyprenyl synthetase family protein [Bacillota bacterium]|nr:polyprenyl synthetase family protein [Bacillota bacterium]
MTKIWNNIPEIKSELDEVQEIINKNLKTKSTKSIEKVIDHLLKANGKRVRAGLLILAAKMGEYNKDRILPLAAAVEMIHLATLVHDDIIDDADTRRGIDSIQHKFGKDSAVYTGDFIFTKAYRLLAGNYDLEENRIIDGMEKVCLGEVFQNENKFNKEMTVRRYLRIISGKTAAMFGLSMYAGAFESKLGDFKSRVIGYSGYYAGMAFQIIDDCMDYTHTSEKMGKNTKVDLLNGVYTLPIIYAVKNDKNNNIKDILNKKNITDLDIEKIFQYVEEYKGVEQAMELAEKYTKKSTTLLKKVGSGKYADITQKVLENLINRKY